MDTAFSFSNRIGEERLSLPKIFFSAHRLLSPQSQSFNCAKFDASFVWRLEDIGRKSWAMGIIESTAEKWHQLTYEQADPRTRDYPLMGSPTAVILICIFYAVLIKVILARYMEQRKAYNTRLLSLGLNIYLFSTACYFFYGAISIGWFSTYSFFCEPLDRSYSDEALRVSVLNCFCVIWWVNM